MNRLITFISVLLVSVLAIAQDGKSDNVLIRQDRVWVSYSWKLGDRMAKFMKFAESREFNNKTYTRVSTIKKVRWEKEDSNIQIDENIDETEAWMREEDGRVYLLLDGWSRYVDSDPDPTYNLTEGLLYDFNVTTGSSYEGISLYRFYEKEPGIYCEGYNQVSGEGTAIVGEEEVKCWDVKFIRASDDDWEYRIGDEYHIVDGIGIVDNGCLFYLETFFHDSGFKSYNTLYCCMDMNGQILYPENFKYELPGGGLPQVNAELINENYSIDIETDSDRTRIFDLQGRELKAPIPGQPYIKDGRILIAPSSTCENPQL